MSSVVLRAAPLSPALFAAAPHRLLFFAGAANVLLAMLWWTLWLVDARWHVLGLPRPPVHPGWLHALVMEYQVLPPFMFGFLLTVFPRWLNQPALPARWYVPVGVGLLGGQALTLAGLLGAPLLIAGALCAIAGWSIGLALLLRVLWRTERIDWHAASCAAALALGLAGLALYVAYLFTGDARFLFVSIKIGGFGLLLPVFVTVAHRMFPFFAGNAVVGYKPWRPLWALAALWTLAVVNLGLELVHAYAWLWIVDVPLLLLACTLVLRWWPVGPKPALLTVLFLGLAWLPVALLLYSAQSIGYLLTGVYALGRAPAHALFVGFFGSILVAMVTRVTQGHSGRALVMPKAAWFAFGAIQLVTLARIGAELANDTMAWQAIAALGWLVAMAPWVARIGRIYLSPRSDGKPG